MPTEMVGNIRVESDGEKGRKITHPSGVIVFETEEQLIKRRTGYVQDATDAQIRITTHDALTASLEN